MSYTTLRDAVRRMAGIAAAAVCVAGTAHAQSLDQIDLSQATVYNSPADIASWPITTTITQLTMQPQGSPTAGVAVTFSAQSTWPNYTPPGWGGPLQYTVWAVVKVNGNWYTSGFIQMWNGRPSTGAPLLAQPGGSCGSLNNFACNWAYDSRWGPMSYSVSGYQPQAAEAVGFFVSAGDARGVKTVTSVRERSNVVVVNLPANDTGTFTFNAPSLWSLVGVTDINKDGSPDFIWRDGSGLFSAWLMSGLTEKGVGMQGGLQIDPTWRFVGTADVNRDGYLDLIVQNTATGVVGVGLMQGTTITGAVTKDFTGDPRWHLMTIGDFNGDGYADFVWQNDSGAVAVRLMNQFTPIWSGVILNAPAGWSVAGVGDLNFDGIPDLIFHHADGWTAVAYVSGTGGVLGVDSLGAMDPSWRLAGVADMNGDGHPDLIWQQGAGGPVQVWFMNRATVVGTAATSPARPQ